MFRTRTKVLVLLNEISQGGLTINNKTKKIKKIDLYRSKKEEKVFFVFFTKFMERLLRKSRNLSKRLKISAEILFIVYICSV